MQFSKNKTTATVIAFFLVLTIAVTLVALPVANAHYPAWNYTTYCYVAPAPVLVGVNQPLLIVWWLNQLPPTSFGAFGDRWKVYVDVTAPDGTNETLGPLTSDPVGGGVTWYTPTQIGTYTLVARFPGQTLTGYPTPSGAPSTNAAVNDTYAASTSKPAYFTVQQEQIPSYQETPLPTGYWTRPVYDTNRGWGNAVMGQWLGGSYYEGLRSTGIPNTAGPESSHILWTRSEWSGGTMGGFGDVAYYNGIAYEGFSSPLVILEGKAYYPVQNPPDQGWYCIDLYTGDTVYFNNNTDGSSAIPTLGQVLDYTSPNQFGGFPYLWRTSGVTLPSGYTSASGTQTWEMLDGFSGNAICKIANVSTGGGGGFFFFGGGGTQFRDAIGSICYINFNNLGTTANPNYYMQIWNTTEAIWWRPAYGTSPPKTLYNGKQLAPSSTLTDNSFWMWRPGATTVGMSTTAYGAIYDGNNGFSMNVSVSNILGPRNAVLNETGSIREVNADQFVIVGTAGRNDARGIAQGFLRAYSLKPNEWGQVLWDKTFTPPKATDDYPNATYSGGVSWGGVSSKDNVFWFTERVTGKIWVYSLTTGQQIWTYTVTSPWAYYGTSLTVHNGKAYTIGTTGIIDCLNATTGTFLWNWTAPSVGYLEDQGAQYCPLSLAFFVDDPLTGREKIYLHGSTGWAGETSPIRRNGAIFCIDTSTGEMLWRLTAYPNYANNGLSKVVISEGRIIYLDNHDNQIYCLGKGPSATTVSAPQTVPTLGFSVVITGTVTDQSPSGRHNVAGDLDFSLKGTPAIADDYMDAWMEYMFHQRPIPTDATGVEVSLDTVDPNGNYVHIGTVTSDINGIYGYAFNPDVPGTYQIIATFAGSAAYGPSSATTYLSVSEAPPATAPPEYPQPIDNTMTIVYATIAIIIAIALVGVWLKRK
jgi:outer membrane protein assembly factor BamB